MSKVSFKNFGYVSSISKNYTISSSRYPHQKKYEKRILMNIIHNLKINKKDEVLDIGCNVGTHLIPLYFKTKKIYGIDHKECISVLKKRLPGISSKQLINGNFLDKKIKKKFNKILCYSVLQYLKNEQELTFFVMKILKILKKDGIVLLGDVPNVDLENNFFKSKKGKNWIKKFNFERKKSKNKNNIESISYFLKNKTKDEFLVKINNKIIKKLINKIKKNKKKVKRIKHSLNAAFGPTRENIIVYN